MTKLIAMLIAYKWARWESREFLGHPEHWQVFRSYYDRMYRTLTEPIFGEPTVVEVVTKFRPSEELEKGEGQ